MQLLDENALHKIFHCGFLDRVPHAQVKTYIGSRKPDTAEVFHNQSSRLKCTASYDNAGA
ncbi:MAG: hypothetical protein Kow00121_16920 [Elainellaceae cyanobacterium]